jgi:hypothetical protein
MYALPALTLIAAEAVAAQFGPYEPPAPAREPARRSHQTRAALAAALERAARAIAPRHPRPA